MEFYAEETIQVVVKNPSGQEIMRTMAQQEALSFIADAIGVYQFEIQNMVNG